MILRAALIGHADPTFKPGGWQLADFAERISWAPRPVNPEQVHVRSFLAANSRPSKDNVLRIREQAIRRFAKLYPGAPVLRNHGTSFLGMIGDDMPIGTVFDAQHRVADDKAAELILPMYFARDDEVGDHAARYIDLGIWKESSIHGFFDTFECSLCGKSFDPSKKEHCDEHVPGDEYEGKPCLIELDDPTEAPEFSLCWSGRLAGTRALAQEVPGTTTVRKLMESRSAWLPSILKRPLAAQPRPWLSGILESRAAA